ncbi:MAG: RidA family protein [Dehalococcoidia bacterium]|jgi:enamine deaminase RidA (YjgF/YER057c/UK114 family)|nr:enamine deaminase RidA [Planctomycetota bacterium]MDP6495560.1 RidA family protein [Dehalococcoidia bacterium]
MKINLIQPQGWPRPSGYSNGVLVADAGSLLFIAGQVGWDSKERMKEGFLPQFRQALENIRAVLEEAGGKPEHLVRVTIYVTDRTAYRGVLAEVGVAWRAILGGVWPAMSLVEVQGLLEQNAVLEIEATAVLP